ncbi:zinc finger, CCHC-type, Gag-polypeptide of LTR copia-type [Artemisia annua]|uniref:Zinc finger, CCHC-type, Gag-polypeptide of LTR copia-type n=1 Tax=Artemisia annua TaxID=35608 RepID=A0A2U1L6S1_ARTAN|nr:zinc finger, CCHC-type, Gag-polypeptide of LTR copia-type [Artemisia annua]
MVSSVGDANTTDSSLPLATILHILTIKPSYSNYLLWRNQTTASNTTSPNPAYVTWQEAYQRALILLQSSLSEEEMTEALGFKTAREVWCSLEAAYSHDSVEPTHTLRDSIRHLQKGDSSVADYGRKLKSICDHFAAIGHIVDDTDKTH